MKDPFKDSIGTSFTLGTRADVLVPDSDTDLPTVPKAVQVTDVGPGNVLKVLPVENEDGNWVTYSGVAVGFYPSFRVRRVHADTTCSVVAVHG